MTERALDLFAEYRAAFERGEHPDPRPYLERAGAEQDALRRLIDEFLVWADPPEPAPETVAVFAAWLRNEPPLLELRRQRRRTRDEVVDALVATLGIDRAKRAKVAEYYHRLEAGLLDLRRIDQRVFSALADALGRQPTGPTVARLRPAGASAYFRSVEPGAPAGELLPLPEVTPEAERDEVDELFTGRRP
jgi:hypothetical protein